MLRMNDRKIFKVTNGPLGNYFVNVKGGKITWSAFTADGYQLRQTDENESGWKEVAEKEMDQLNPRFTLGSPPGISHAEFSDILHGNAISRTFNENKYKKS